MNIQAIDQDSDLRNKAQTTPSAYNNNIANLQKKPSVFGNQTPDDANNTSPYRNLLFAFENDPFIEPQHRYIAFICHGLEGNSFDMRHIRAAIIDVFPDCVVYILNNNFNLTNQSIKLQAKRLACEVEEILESFSFYGRVVDSLF